MRWIYGGVFRLVVFGVIWLALSEADPTQFVYGLFACATATAVSLWLLPPNEPTIRRWPRRVWGTVMLAGWFIQQSFTGGVDVARRAIRPTVDVEPEIIDVVVELPEGAAQQVCLVLMNLLPGSMVQHTREVNGQTVAEIHTLSRELEPEKQWARLQNRVHQLNSTPQPEPTGLANPRDAV